MSARAQVVFQNITCTVNMWPVFNFKYTSSKLKGIDPLSSEATLVNKTCRQTGQLA